METWDPTLPGVVRLPSGRLVRGRALRNGGPDQPPDSGLYLLSRPPRLPWPSRWVHWPDLRLPVDEDDARDAMREVWRRAPLERVEVACGGGRGGTGTALACLAVLDGLPAADTVAWVREHYAPGAVETPWQRRWVARSSGAPQPPSG